MRFSIIGGQVSRLPPQVYTYEHGHHNVQDISVSLVEVKLLLSIGQLEQSGWNKIDQRNRINAFQLEKQVLDLDFSDIVM